MSHEMLWTSAPALGHPVCVGWNEGRQILLPTSQPVAQAGVPLPISELRVAALQSFHHGKKAQLL